MPKERNDTAVLGKRESFVVEVIEVGVCFKDREAFHILSINLRVKLRL